MSHTQFVDPNLLTPGDPSGAKVNPLNALTMPLPIVETDVVKHYICVIPNASLHRTDGKRLGFVSNYFSSNDLHDQKYLDGEIAARHPYLRVATDDEVMAARMRANPTGTITEKVRAELEPQIRAELEIEIRARLEAEIRGEVTGTGVDITDAEKIAGTNVRTSAAQSLMDKLSAGIKSGTGVIIPTNGTVDPVGMKLGGIVSTADLPK